MISPGTPQQEMGGLPSLPIQIDDMSFEWLEAERVIVVGRAADKATCYESGELHVRPCLPMARFPANELRRHRLLIPPGVSYMTFEVHLWRAVTHVSDVERKPPIIFDVSLCDLLGGHLKVKLPASGEDEIDSLGVFRATAIVDCAGFPFKALKLGTQAAPAPILERVRTTLEMGPAMISLLKGDNVASALRSALRGVIITLAAVWLVWKPRLTLLVDKHKPTGDDPNFPMFSAVVSPQDDAVDDAVSQIYWEMTFVRDILKGDKTRVQVNSPPVFQLLRELLVTTVRRAAFVFGWAGQFPHTSYANFSRFGAQRSNLPPNSRFEFEQAYRETCLGQTSLLRISYRLRMAMASRNGPPLPKADDALVEALYRAAKDELERGVSRGPFISTLEILTGPIAQRAYAEMRKDMQSSNPATRDILRRMMTHLAQRSGRLPSWLMLKNVSKDDVAIGRGSYAAIYRGTLKLEDASEEKVAVKSLHLLSTSHSMELRRMQMSKELLTLATLSHPHVLTTYGVAQDLPGLCIVTPWLPNGNLHDYLKSISPEPEDRPSWLLNKLIKEIALGLQYLHDESMAHGDLRGVNVLIDGDGNARIADFGLCVFVRGHAENYASTRSGSCFWAAPEMIIPPSGYDLRPTFATDIYSFSHACIEVYIGAETPYPNYQQSAAATAQFMMKVTAPDNPLRPTRPDNMPDALWRLLQRCWAADPTVRPAAADVVRAVSRLDRTSRGKR